MTSERGGDINHRRAQTKSKWFGTMGCSIFAVFPLGLLVLTLWGVVVEPRFLLDVRYEQAEVRNLPESWDGEHVVLLADFQVGMWLDNDGMVKKAVQKAVELDPAAVLIAGDFIYGKSSDRIDRVIDLVRPLAEAKLPTYAVFGNHDYSMMKADSAMELDIAEELKTRLSNLGIVVLENDARRMVPRAGGAPLTVVGVGSTWAGQSNPDSAFGELSADEPRIVLMHNPIAFRDLPPHSASLTLSAHTHGGQLRVPYTRSSSWLDIARQREVIADGWGEQGIGNAGNRIYINRGIGFSMIPARFHCRPELTVFTLRPAGPVLPERGPESDR